MTSHRDPQEIAANRARYEEHQRKGLEFSPRAMPEPSARPATALAASTVIHKEVIPGGWHWQTKLKAGEAIRIAQTDGMASVALIAWSAADPTERLNLPDTIKVQWTTGITKGRVLFSDMGRVLFSVIEDSCGGHDVLVGGSTKADVAQGSANAKLRNTRDNFILAAGKLGLTRRDIPTAISFFAPVRVDEEGTFIWNSDLVHGDDYVDLRAEMDVVLALSNCAHPLDPKGPHEQPPVTITRFRAPEPAADDLCRTASAEAIRGFENNARASA